MAANERGLALCFDKSDSGLGVSEQQGDRIPVTSSPVELPSLYFQ